jgi:hypothetical protein
MTIRAVAFAGRDNAKRIAVLFGTSENEVFGGTTLGGCRKCLKEFHITMALLNDEDNAAYFRTIENMIAADCKSGQHEAEYILRTRP